MLERHSIGACTLVMTLVIATVACSPPESTGAPQSSVATPATSRATMPEPADADARRLAADLPLLPPGITLGVRPPQVIRATYEFAARHPEVLNYMPCFCGCERGGHRGNHDCFVAARDRTGRVTQWDSHAIGCEVCLDVARDAMQMHNSGASVPAIRDAIERKYAAPGRPHTPTPMPKRGDSHDPDVPS